MPQLKYFIYQISWDYILKNLAPNAEALLNTSKYIENAYSTEFIRNEGNLEYIINYSCNDQVIVKRLFERIHTDFLSFNTASNFKLIYGYVSLKVYKYSVYKHDICVASIKFINDTSLIVSNFIILFIFKEYQIKERRL
jgi:hypothetical protein